MGLNSMDNVSESHKYHRSTASMAYPTLTLSHTGHRATHVWGSAGPWMPSMRPVRYPDRPLFTFME